MCETKFVRFALVAMQIVGGRKFPVIRSLSIQTGRFRLRWTNQITSRPLADNLGDPSF
jgi:hypothetical protein